RRARQARPQHGGQGLACLFGGDGKRLQGRHLCSVNKSGLSFRYTRSSPALLMYLTEGCPPLPSPTVSLRLSLLMFLLWTVPASLVPLYSSHLDQLGFSPLAVAVCCATQSAAGVVASLLAGHV